MEALHAAREFLYWAALIVVLGGLVLHQWIIVKAAQRHRSAAVAKLERDAAHIRRAR